MQVLNQLTEDALKQIHATEDLAGLEDIRLQFLGKKGQLTEALKNVGQQSPAERPLIGQAVNVAKEAIQTALETKRQQLQAESLQRKLASESVDITLPGRGVQPGHLHPITRAMQRITAYFSQMGFEIVKGQEIETEHYNFDALNIPAYHPARAMHDTFYIAPQLLLRTHTSAAQVRYMETHQPPLRMLAMGKVYRCESDATHTPMFHQVEGLFIDTEVTFADLKGLLKDFLQFFFEQPLEMRFRASYFPFTEPSAEVDMQCVLCQGQGCRVCKQTGWLEILGCGMVHPFVLEGVNIAPETHQGFAFGIGIDRLAMLKYHIQDLRLLFDNDVRFLEQF